MSNRSASALCAAALLALVPLAARAETKLAVVDLFSPPSMMGMAGLLAQKAIHAAEARPSTAVMRPDAVSAQLGPENMKRLQQCELKAPCVASALSGTGAQQALVGTLERDEVHYVVNLVLVDVAKGTVLGSGQRTVLIASRQLEPEFQAMLAQVLAGKVTGPARLTVTTNAKHVRVSVDDRPQGEAPVTVEVSPGKHEVRLEKPGYLPEDRFVEVPAGQETALRLPLTLLPNAVDPDEAAATPGVRSEGARSEGGWSVPATSWIALGAGAALAGVGAGFGIASRSIATRAVDPDGDGALNVTRVEALAGQRDATIANVAFGAAGAAAVAAAIFYFVGQHGDESAPKVSAMPLPGGGLARVQVGL